MLTIKHIDTDGTERLMEAETVDVVKQGSHFEDGIFIDRKLVGDGPTYEGQPTTFKHVIHFAQARSSDDVNPIVYVMNRFGATVARYPL